MIHQHRFGVFRVLLITIAAYSCGGGDSNAPSGPGTLDVSIVTTGVDLDTDGFLLTVDAESPRTTATNGSLTISEPSGSHTLAMDGLAINCDATFPATVVVAAAQATRVDVQVTCKKYLSNAIVYVSDEFGNGELMAMRPDGSRRVRLTSDQVVYDLPAVSPDGQSIAVASFLPTVNEGIFLLDRFGKGRTKLVSRSNDDGAPAWSPDGTKLAFRSKVASGADRIFIINRDGTGLLQLTPETTNEFTTDDSPTWSPDGQRIAFSRTGVIYLINVDGTSLVATTPGHHPSWSPNGKQIAYDNNGIFVIDATQASRRLTSFDGDFVPRWSPDNTRLVFQRTEGAQYKLYVVGANGNGLNKISPSGPSDNWPTWSPLP